MKPGANRDGWWKTEDLVKQVNIFLFIILKTKI
jgi:hypothetical protein